MTYARLIVKSNSGLKIKWIAYEEPWICGRYLKRYYGGVATELLELGTIDLNTAKSLGHKFKVLK